MAKKRSPPKQDIAKELQQELQKRNQRWRTAKQEKQQNNRKKLVLHESISLEPVTPHSGKEIHFQRRKSSYHASRASFSGYPDEDFSEPYFIRCPAKCYQIAISYSVIPGKTVQIVMSCYKYAFKVCSKDEVAAAKMGITKHFNWIAFSIIHKFPIPNAEDAMHYLRHRIEFVLSEERTSASFRSSQDKTTTYFCFNEVDENGDNLFFENIYLTQKNIVPEKHDYAKLKYQEFLKDRHKELTEYLSGVPMDSHSKFILEKIQEIEEMIEPRLSSNQPQDGGDINYDLISGPIVGGAKINRADKDLTITGEQLFYDKLMWQMERFKLSQKIRYFGVWFTSDNLLSREVRERILPLGIGVRCLQNVPHHHNIDNSKISLEYSFGKILTDCIPVPMKKVDESSRKIHFNHYRTFLLNQIPWISILETLQFEKIKVKIWYHSRFHQPCKKLNDDHITNNKIFTSLFEDETFCERIVHRPLAAPDTRTVFRGKVEFVIEPAKSLIGYAFVDCSSLLKGRFRIDAESPVTTVCGSSVISGDIMTHYNALELHDDSSNVSKPEGIVPEYKLREEGTSLKIDIRFSGISLKNLLEDLSTQPGVYRRMIVKFKSNDEHVKTVVKRILTLNSEVLPNPICSYPFVPTWYVIKPAKSDDEDEVDPNEYNCALTGFFIDNLQSSLLVVEGYADLTFNNALVDVLLLPSESGEVLYSGVQLFYEVRENIIKRAYSDFLNYGGIYHITLKCELNEILKKKNLYKTGNVPVRTLRTLTILHQLSMCDSIETAVRNKLFPSSQDLLSFEMEFGEPHIFEKFTRK